MTGLQTSVRHTDYKAENIKVSYLGHEKRESRPNDVWELKADSQHQQTLVTVIFF